MSLPHAKHGTQIDHTLKFCLVKISHELLMKEKQSSQRLERQRPAKADELKRTPKEWSFQQDAQKMTTAFDPELHASCLGWCATTVPGREPTDKIASHKLTDECLAVLPTDDVRRGQPRHFKTIADCERGLVQAHHARAFTAAKE